MTSSPWGKREGSMGPGMLLFSAVKGVDFGNGLRLLDGQLRLRTDNIFCIASPE